MKTLGVTHSVCAVCRALVPAKVVTDDGDGGGDVHFLKFCAEHGEMRSLVSSDIEDYLRSQRYVKPAWTPREFAGDASLPCPEGCGFCERHEQHLCLPIIEITARCDLTCPVCLVDAGYGGDMSPEEFRAVLDGLVRAERQVDILNLSGGEPLLHPEIVALIDEALARPEIVRVSLSTNGLRLLEEPRLLAALKERDAIVSLQFDGFNDGIYETLRGRPLLEQKLKILELLGKADVTTSLTMTAAGGVNEDQFRPMLDLLFSRGHIVSLMIQPLAFVGRGAGLAGRTKRLTIPDVIGALGTAGHPAVSASDFSPLPCSHPLCFSLAYYLMLDDGRAVSVGRLVEADKMMDTLANRTIFGLDPEEHERLREMIYELWSGPAASAPDSEAVLRTLRGLLRRASDGRFNARRAFAVAERSVKSVFIHAFQDAGTFDLARARRCCNAYPQPDGRLMPACVHNVLRRNRANDEMEGKVP